MSVINSVRYNTGWWGIWWFHQPTVIFAFKICIVTSALNRIFAMSVIKVTSITMFSVVHCANTGLGIERMTVYLSLFFILTSLLDQFLCQLHTDNRGLRFCYVNYRVYYDRSVCCLHTVDVVTSLTDADCYQRATVIYSNASKQ